ncbi:MAG: hypothetical protein Q9195_002517 [Heterodermia aff. obscurata]
MPDQLGASRPIAPYRIVIFHRLIRFYNNCTLLSALVAGLSVGALQFPELHPAATTTTQAAEGFLTSAACSAVFAVMLATMLSFHFDGQDSATRWDYGVAWIPLILLDWSIVAVLLGLLCWYWERGKGWRFGMLFAGMVLVFVFVLWLALTMFKKLRYEGIEREEEERPEREEEERPEREGQDALKEIGLRC